MVNLNFGGIIVPINTSNESMLFSWMLFHNETEEFRIGKYYFKLIEKDYYVAKIKVKVADKAGTVVSIEKPYEWRFSENIDNLPEFIDYNHSGNYTAHMKGCRYVIGTPTDGDVSLSFKIDDNLKLIDVSASNRIYPNITNLGVDDGYNQYLIEFKNWYPYKLYYNLDNPLDSYVIEV